MKKIKILVIFLSIFLVLSCKSKVISKHSKTISTSSLVKKPNILIIHVDDLGYHDLSIHGSKIYQTPNIDALAKESVKFTNA